MHFALELMAFDIIARIRGKSQLSSRDIGFDT